MRIVWMHNKKMLRISANGILSIFLYRLFIADEILLAVLTIKMDYAIISNKVSNTDSNKISNKVRK